MQALLPMRGPVRLSPEHKHHGECLAEPAHEGRNREECGAAAQQAQHVVLLAELGKDGGTQHDAHLHACMHAGVVMCVRGAARGGCGSAGMQQAATAAMLGPPLWLATQRAKQRAKQRQGNGKAAAKQRAKQRQSNGKAAGKAAAKQRQSNGRATAKQRPSLPRVNRQDVASSCVQHTSLAHRLAWVPQPVRT